MYRPRNQMCAVSVLSRCRSIVSGVSNGYYHLWSSSLVSYQAVGIVGMVWLVRVIA